MENNCEKLKLCTPKSLRDVEFWHIHDSETSGHLGIRKTYAKLMAKNYYWPHMRRYVQDYVSSCDICEERKNLSRRKRAYMKDTWQVKSSSKSLLTLLDHFRSQRTKISTFL